MLNQLIGYFGTGLICMLFVFSIQNMSFHYLHYCAKYIFRRFCCFLAGWTLLDSWIGYVFPNLRALKRLFVLFVEFLSAPCSKFLASLFLFSPASREELFTCIWLSSLLIILMYVNLVSFIVEFLHDSEPVVTTSMTLGDSRSRVADSKSN